MQFHLNGHTPGDPDGHTACPDLKNGADIFDLRGIARKRGAVVAVRPDQCVANVLPLDALNKLAAFFGRFLLDRHQASS